MVMSKGLLPHRAFIFSLYLSHFEGDIQRPEGSPSTWRAVSLSLTGTLTRWQRRAVAFCTNLGFQSGPVNPESLHDSDDKPMSSVVEDIPRQVFNGFVFINVFFYYLLGEK